MFYAHDVEMKATFINRALMDRMSETARTRRPSKCHVVERDPLTLRTQSALHSGEQWRRAPDLYNVFKPAEKKNKRRFFKLWWCSCEIRM